MALTALVSGAGLAVFAAAPLLPLPPSLVPWVATPALVVVGFGSVAYLTTAAATLQLRIPNHLTGRVMGLWVVMNAGTMPLGSLALGAAAERIGLPQVIVASGLAGILIGLYLLLPRTATLTQESAVQTPTIRAI